MTFGEIIRKLRRDADLTQERLAEILSISPQAVSRWETDMAMPDVSLLPALANLFDVTTDYLLGVDLTKKKENIRKIRERANGEFNLRTEEGWERGIQILRDGLKLYP
ncbi:MAG: helix-turn-helix transcriptional regulator, partial [Clostridia bacterium]|nr:helix-turn-helix transcriptional regulator [Clostridia bacterium]